LDVLRIAAPLAGPILGIAAGELKNRISDDIALTQVLLDEIRDPAADRRVATGMEARGPASRADTDADFRTLRQELIKLDEAKWWGGLSYHITPEDIGLYLCADHLAAYQRLPPAPRG
jgi:internalin A